MEDLEGYLKKVLGDLAALPEEAMRLNLLARRLCELSPEDSARLIEILYKMPDDDQLASRARSIFIDHEGIKNALGPRYSEIYSASLKLGLRKVRKLFSELPPHKKGVRDYEDGEGAGIGLLPLGMRRQLSKSPVKNIIDRLLADPDPTVIANLLNNPRLTEKEVLKIVSKRPNSEKILKIVSTHRVWAKRYEVMKAIVFNPYTPPRVSIGFLDFMLVQDLEKAALDKTLHPEVKMSARDLLDEKKGKS